MNLKKNENSHFNFFFNVISKSIKNKRENIIKR